MNTEKPTLSPASDLRPVMNGLLTTLSHDLRTPLSTISGWLFMLESDKLDAAGKKRALEKIRANIQSQVRLIDDVLLLSRCMTGHLEIAAAPILLHEPLNAAIESLRATAAAGLVGIATVVTADMATVMADEALLGRVFEILLKHAIDATPKGKSIAVAIESKGGHVDVTIADQGNALSTDALATLFDAFSEDEGTEGRVHADDARNLMLAKMLVEKQGGELRATGGDELDKGTGTTFTLRLPGIDADAVLVPVIPQPNQY